MDAALGQTATRVSVLETRFDAILATLATKSDVAEVRADMSEVQADIHRWMLATVVGLFLGFGGLFLAMSNALRPMAATPAAANMAPIVITVPAAAFASLGAPTPVQATSAAKASP
jgi:hypothetical protein